MKSLSVHRILAGVRWPGLWPLFDLPTHLTDREKVELFKIARTESRRSREQFFAAEIGSYLGASASFIAAGLADGGRLFCVDTWTNESMSEGGRDTFEDFLANTTRDRERILPLRGWSTDQDVVDRIAAAACRVGFLFIDGDHAYDAVVRDWRTYAPLMAPGGVVAMHDVGWAEGVQRVVEEELRPLVASEHRLPNLWWGRLAT